MHKLQTKILRDKNNLKKYDLPNKKTKNYRFITSVDTRKKVLDLFKKLEKNGYYGKARYSIFVGYEVFAKKKR
jgi:hypothetical protein